MFTLHESVLTGAGELHLDTLRPQLRGPEREARARWHRGGLIHADGGAGDVDVWVTNSAVGGGDSEGEPLQFELHGPGCEVPSSP